MYKHKKIEFYFDTETLSFSTKNNQDFQLFIIWENARNKELQILNDISKNFKVLDCFECVWTQNFMGDNFHRLYNLPPTGKASTKSIYTGEGAFLVIVIEDLKPNYAYRFDASGNFKLVNSNVVDKKRLYRSWTQGEYLVHSSDNLNEFYSNASLIFSSNKLSNIIKGNWDGDIKNLAYDLAGAATWSTYNELFNVLNSSTNYVVLRNSEGIDKTVNDLEGDIDILCEDVNSFIAISNAKKIDGYENFFHISIANKDVLFDVRYVGDDYFDENWQRDILEHRILTSDNIFIPRVDDHFFSHLYHAFVHKKYSSLKYEERLNQLAINIGIFDLKEKYLSNPNNVAKLLNGFMHPNDYAYVSPKDISVFINVSFVAILENKNKIFLFVRLINFKVKTLPRVYFNKLKVKLKKNKFIYNLVTYCRRVLKK